MKTIAFSLALTGLLVALASPALEGAEERIEGTVVKVPKGTEIKKGNEHVFLPGLKGSQVAIAYVNDKGARVAKSIEVKSAKP